MMSMMAAKGNSGPVVQVNVASNCAGGTNGATTTGVDTTAAIGGLGVFVISYGGGTTPVLTDNFANTWIPNTPLFTQNPNLRVYYAENFLGGAGHTFTTSASGSFVASCVNTFSNASQTAPFDKQSAGGSNPFSTTIQPGSTTPTLDGSVLIVAVGYNSNAVTGVDTGFTRSGTKAPGGGSNYGLDIAYKIQGSKAAENPTYTFTGSMPVDATMSVFR